MTTTIGYDTDFAQLGIYNTLATEYGGGLNPSNIDNSSILQGIIIDALTAVGTQWSDGGGVVYIPSGSYQFTTPIAIDAHDYEDKGLLIIGDGGSTELVVNFNTDDPFIKLSHFSSGKGIRFKNLRITYNADSLHDPSGSAAIYLDTCQNVTCDEVFFGSCPQAMYISDGCIQCGLKDCTIEYAGPDDQTMIDLEGSQCYVRGCVMRQNGEGASVPGPSGCIAIFVGSVSTAYITDCHISDFEVGIEIGGNAKEAFFSNLRVNAYKRGVYFNSGPHPVNDILFSDCIFYLTSDSTQPYPGIYVDGDSSQVGGIIFNNCICYGWYGSGLHINAGRNIVITGGQYSANGLGPAEDDPYAAGIEITGGSNIVINGAVCSGKNQNLSSADVQPYGISINTVTGSEGEGPSPSDITINCCVIVNNATNGIIINGAGGSGEEPTNILICDCDLTGYSDYQTAIDITGTVSNVQVTTCAGYNDQSVPVRTTAPASSPFGPTTYGYYGPVVVYGVGSASLVVSQAGHATGLGNGTFTIAPGQSLSYVIGLGGHTWTTFTMVGQ